MKPFDFSVLHYRLGLYGRRIHLWIGILCLTGCWSPLSLISSEKMYAVPEIAPGLRMMSWSLRREELRSLTTFTVKGYLEVRAHKHKGVNLAFRWEQSFDLYRLQLFDESGKASIEIIADKKRARLYVGDKVYLEKSAELLLKKHLGVRIPLSYFTDWLKGVPQFNTKHERVLNPTKHLLTLQQAGWFVRYLRYHQVRKMDLPTQLCMMQNGWYVRILVSHWAL